MREHVQPSRGPSTCSIFNLPNPLFRDFWILQWGTYSTLRVKIICALAQASGQGAAVHSQALVALGLVSALQCCADAYVCSEALRSRDLAGGGAEAHIRAVNMTLGRLLPRIDPFDDLRADMQVRSLSSPSHQGDYPAGDFGIPLKFVTLRGIVCRASAVLVRECQAREVGAAVGFQPGWV